MRRVKLPRNILNFSAAALFLFCAGFTALTLPGRADAATMLSLDDCLRIADENHPSLAGAAAQIATEQGRLGQSVVADRLTVSGTATTERVGTNKEEVASYSAGGSASVKVFDANRNKYVVDAQRKTLTSTEESARDTLLGVHTNVKTSYMTLLLNIETSNQRLESVNAFTRHLEQAQGFYDAGSKPWYDVTKAKVDLGNAELALVQAQGDVELAKRELVNSMGVILKDDFSIAPASFDVPQGTESKADELALENRSDYKAAGLKVLAGKSTINAEARGSSPTISVVGSYNASGYDVFDLDNGWNAGLKLTVPIVDGGATKAKVATAQGQLGSLEATYEKLRQDILLDVGKAITDLRKAREQVRISSLTLEDAEENRKLAEGRYETGVGTPLEVTDALLNLTDAQLSSYNARYNLQIAIISLESAIGVEFE